MPLFLLLYIVVAIAVVIGMFFLAYNERKNDRLKTVITIVYILSIIGIIFSMGCLEVKYGYSKLFSSVLAAAIIGAMYLADSMGNKLSSKKEGKD